MLLFIYLLTNQSSFSSLERFQYEFVHNNNNPPETVSRRTLVPSFIAQFFLRTGEFTTRDLQFFFTVCLDTLYKKYILTKTHN